MNKIDPINIEWLNWPETKKLVAALGDENMRFVGGAVRDSLLKTEVVDVDVATILKPDEVIARLEFAEIKAIPTGIEHGTVTAVVDHRHFEITTLRRDVKSHGRHADVAFTDNWEEDAKRRDFTFNALYLDVEGNIYDYFGGKEDLANGQIKFIGNPLTRIEEDALRILRFFRFMALFGINNVPEADLNIVTAEAERLTFLSAERVRDELKKLLMGKDCVPVLRLMMQTGVWNYILVEFEVDNLERLIAVEEALGNKSFYRRLSRVLPVKIMLVRQAIKKLRLSNAEAVQMLALLHPDPRILVGMSDKDKRETIYRYGPDVFKDHAILNANAKDANALEELFLEVDVYEVPKFPVRGADLIDMGIVAGPEMGELLGMLEERWIASDFLISRHDLLDMAKSPNLH